MTRVLFVFTSVDTDLKGKPTGWYLPEAAHPYYVLQNDAVIDLASPKGPNPPVAPRSNFPGDKKFLEDEKVKAKFANAKKLSEVDVNDYDAIFYVGGHGPAIDLPTDPVNVKLASQFWQAGKIVAAVCHGPAAIVGATDDKGVSIFKDREATGFSDAEEFAIDQVKAVPFLLEERIKELGGKYTKSDQPWVPKVVVDGKLITGQNPASADPIGHALLKALKGE